MIELAPFEERKSVHDKAWQNYTMIDSHCHHSLLDRAWQRKTKPNQTKQNQEAGR